MGDEKGFQIHIQSHQSWQLVTCRQGRCPARADQHGSVFLASWRSRLNSTLVNVYVDLVVFTRIAGTLKTGSGRYWP